MDISSFLLRCIPVLGIICIIVSLLTLNRRQQLSKERYEIAKGRLAVAEKAEQLTKQIMDTAFKHMKREQVTQITWHSGIRELRFRPELRANETFQKLMDQLESLENEREELRKAHNNFAERHNAFITSFPAKLCLLPEARELCEYEEKIDELGPVEKLEEAWVRKYAGN